MLWEEKDTEPVDLDGATISLGNLEQTPYYLELGRMYVPFGPCRARHVHCIWVCDEEGPTTESSFITDPLCLELGETREIAARFGVLCDYVGALRDFSASDLRFGRKARPRAWIVEASVALTGAWSAACKYERANDVFDWLHSQRYGVCTSYIIYEDEAASAALAFEYLRGKYDEGTDTTDDIITLQVVVEF